MPFAICVQQQLADEPKFTAHKTRRAKRVEPGHGPREGAMMFFGDDSFFFIITKNEWMNLTINDTSWRWGDSQQWT